jgi:hypothetical protein
VKVTPWLILSLFVLGAVLTLFALAWNANAAQSEALGGLAGKLAGGWLGVALGRKIFSRKNPWRFS